MPHRAFRRFVPSVLPALAAAFALTSAGDSFARERCASKPAVCARLKTAERARAATRAQPFTQQATRRNDVVASRSPGQRCTSKPAVCARRAGQDLWPSSLPVTVNASVAQGSRCASKPAVCARLKMRPSSQPFTLASAGL